MYDPFDEVSAFGQTTGDGQNVPAGWNAGRVVVVT